MILPCLDTGIDLKVKKILRGEQNVRIELV